MRRWLVGAGVAALSATAAGLALGLSGAFAPQAPVALAAAAPREIVVSAPTVAPSATATPLPVASPSATAVPVPRCQPCRVGLQVGHWRAADLPAELADLRENSGGAFGAYRELDVNLAVVQAAAALLQQAGISVDVLPATIPPKYTVDAFVAVHADQDPRQHARGYKVAGSSLSGDKAASSLLSRDLGAAYETGTGLPPDLRPSAITPAMRFYYAFNPRFQHAIAQQVPAAIIELGFVTDSADRDLLFGRSGVAADSLVRGIERFLAGQ